MIIEDEPSQLLPNLTKIQDKIVSLFGNSNIKLVCIRHFWLDPPQNTKIDVNITIPVPLFIADVGD